MNMFLRQCGIGKNQMRQAALILLANSKARQIRTYDGATNGIITRAKAEVLVFSRQPQQTNLQHVPN
jgi:hypothetical protein